ncbi:hypothetical protein O9G_002031 [Rozella allomycis CSF55]|uniref:Uncharacterized protein n=1 Tax=Rozella allomycis (strain CSF55) TaxID=988480 RepID=A0A075AX42_ROZAC|nr:hypothetical protein O9G_002031 [Rozella allomycis CSF55]|eukprot:EPZ34900.1 hypothetical protein O9G_002031 [Rozella allomycis CSF55]
MKSVWEREYSDKALFILPGYESEEDEDDEQNYYLRTSNRKSVDNVIKATRVSNSLSQVTPSKVKSIY